MRTCFILIWLQCLGLNGYTQVKAPVTSNNWYFSQSDTLFFSQAHIKTNAIRQVKEYRIDKKYADSAQLMSEYNFDPSGSLTGSRTYDIHGSPSVTQFKNTPDGKLTESWVSGMGGLAKTAEYIYDGDKLIRQNSLYAPDYVTSIEYTYRPDGLTSSVQHIGATGLKGANTVFIYDSTGRLVSEATKNAADSIVFRYLYKYDQLGRRCLKEYKEAGLDLAETTDYSGSTLNCTVERIYAEGKLREIRAEKTNQQGLTTELIIDKRMSLRKSRRKNIFCGYSGPPRYQKWTYAYNANGNLTSEKKYYAPHKVSEKIEYTFDGKGNLIHKVVFKHSKKDSEWSYTYN